MSAIQLYQHAQTVAQMDASNVPTIAHLYCTQAIHDHYAPWTERESSAPPAMAYKHWNDLVSMTVYGKIISKEAARAGDPLDYRTLNYLNFFVGQHMAEWIEKAKTLDPIKGYKPLRKEIAAPILKEEAARFRIAVQILEDDMLAVMQPLLVMMAA